MSSSSFFNLAYKGNNEWWNYLTTIFLVIAGYFLGQVPLSLVQLSKIDKLGLGNETFEEFATTMDFSLFEIDKNLGLFLMILIFVFATAGLWLGLKLQGKKFLNIITPHSSINWKKIGFGFIVWFGLTFFFELIMYLIDPSGYSFQFNPERFLILFLICIMMLPIQTSFEEFFFRGYLMQGFSLISKNKWVPLILSTLLFAAVHGTNPEIEKYGFLTMQVYYITAGFVLGIIIIMDDGLELALGIHAATNFYGATMVTYEGSVLQTDSLVKSASVNPLLLNTFFILMSIIFLYLSYRKYNWRSFSYILEPVRNNSDVI
jgi:membrane protease YdiL (CAAX protease family)